MNRPEARHRYWHIIKEDRDFFPPAGKEFQLKFHDKTYVLKVNHKDDIMTGQIYHDYRLLEGNEIKIKKVGKKFVLTADEAQSW
ncbi:MAG: hypothetical protein OEL82_10925 [Nitrosopumilus sp.]|nr:hypothetical protein [Nitrosopumilus sp.]